MMRGAMRAINDMADPDIRLAPVHAFYSQDGLGYQMRSATADPVTGVSMTGYDDNVHPFNALRVSMFRALAAYVAAGSTGAI